MATLRFVKGNFDWTGLYVDDVCVAQNHSLEPEDVLDALCGHYIDCVEYVTITESAMDRLGNSLPRKWPRLKRGEVVSRRVVRGKQ